MNEVTETATHTAFARIEPTTRFSEVCHGAQFAINGPRRIPPTVERVARLLRAVLIFEPRVHVAD